MPEGHEVLPAVERSGGNPLFAEEMARLSEDGGIGHPLPDTVQGCSPRGWIHSSLSSAGLQQAAVVGRTFWESSLVPLAEAEDATSTAHCACWRQKDILAPASEGAWPESANSPSSTC